MSERFDAYSFFDGTSMTPVTQITWSDYWRGVIPDGVVGNVGDEMKPYANSTGMRVYLSPGACIVDNHRAVLDSTKQLNVAAADTTYPRIDIIVARVVYGNENESYVELDVKSGEAYPDPEPPELVQTTGSVYEIKLAEIYVEANVITLLPETVTDTRNIFTAGRQSISFINGDTVPLEKGMLVKLRNDLAGAVLRCDTDSIPMGVVESDYIAVGASGQIATRPGDIAEIMCNEKEIKIGDALIPSDNDLGLAKSGSGFAGGIALQAKASGSVGNVKSLLAFFSKLPTQNAWYLPSGISEENVIAAYRFVGRATELQALLNINDGTEYALSKLGDVTWNAETGFYIPDSSQKGLANDTLKDLWENVHAAAFGYAGCDTSGTALGAGGLLMGYKRSLTLRGVHGVNSNKYYLKNLAISYSNGSSSSDAATDQAAGSLHPAGVLGGNWEGSGAALFHNGESKSITNAYSNEYRHDTACVFGNYWANSSGNAYDFALAPFYMTAIVLFNTTLSAAQHLELYNNIRGLGGIS